MMSNKVIFPLNDKKAPAVPQGTDWRDYHGEANSPLIGVMIPQGVIVLDVDTYKGATTEQVDTALGVALDWDSAELQTTMHGGKHYAFAVPFDVELINGQDVLGVKGFDTRSSLKGYIATGRGYSNLTFMDSVSEALHQREAWPVLPVEVVGRIKVEVVEDCDLLSAIAEQPLDISADDVKAYMSKLPDSCAEDGAQWLKVGMALYHQFGGAESGWLLFDEFSKRCADKYDARMNRKRWDSFGKKKPAKPVTFASVIELAGGRQVEVVSSAFDGLLVEARQVESLAQYNQLKNKVKALGERELTTDLRGMVAAELATRFGKENGITKTEIKKALLPVKKEKRRDAEDVTPFWLDGWVYVEMTCEFANTQLNYAIKREAFNAKFDREPECIMAEKSAAQMALQVFKIPTVVDKMFWPGAEMIFEHDSKLMLNAYYVSGVTPADEIDLDGEIAISAFLKHVEFTLDDKREQGILLDWLAYVIKHPGQRVNWALLLQGAQGTGKSYFVKLLQYIMGEHVRNLDPTAIAGRFTGWAHGATVVAVEEIRISGTNKYEVLDRMKPFITNDTVQIEEKGRDHRTVPNFTSYLLLTNHKDAIPLTSGDRRYCVLFSRVQTEQQLFAELGGEEAAERYFSNLFDLTRDNADALARWFLDREISSEFKPKGRAPETMARQMMMNIATSPERLAVEDAIEKHRCDVINENVLDITWLNKLCEMEGEELPKTRAMTAILLEMGYEQMPGRRLKISSKGAYHYVWVRVQSKIDCAPIVRNFHDGDCPF